MMNRLRLMSAVSVLVLTSASQQLAAQTGAPRPPQMIDLATARKAAAAAEAAAVALQKGPVAIAVMDANGDLVHVQRMDGASPRAVTSSMGHARAALLFGISDILAYDAMKAGKPISVMLSQLPQGNWEITIEPGGIPITKDGKIIGAIGVGGIPSLDDEKVAQAGVDALAR